MWNLIKKSLGLYTKDEIPKKMIQKANTIIIEGSEIKGMFHELKNTYKKNLYPGMFIKKEQLYSPYFLLVTEGWYTNTPIDKPYEQGETFFCRSGLSRGSRCGGTPFVPFIERGIVVMARVNDDQVKTGTMMSIGSDFCLKPTLKKNELVAYALGKELTFVTPTQKVTTYIDKENLIFVELTQ
jgi:hypothetical protein